MKGGPADPIADVELDAYIDGQLDSARRADVEAFLARDARAAARVSADLRLRDALRQGATRHGADARDAHTRALADRLQAAHARRRVARRARRLLAVAILVVAGWAGHAALTAWTPVEPAGDAGVQVFLDEAMRAHRTAQLRAGMRSQPAAPRLDRAELARQAGVPLPAWPWDWLPRDVQVFPSRGGPAVEVALVAGRAGPISLYGAPGGAGPDSAPRMARGAGAETLFWWRRGAWVYAVIGALPEAVLRPLAQRLADAPLVYE
ncbi:hypothetical protein L535_2666 [Bordetella bronchiseptica SBL-F6116]|uniref:transmembrane regulator n=1 Tax=Bordetella bronchiseptica TaxID=518 RepID=UPI0004A19593|nr:transmembrane regulator [Bordetella bronchiseptica]KDE01269.1 hypothetical protein L535_2666 [Bordetella bronchiseptica SBL-F6116]